MGSSQLTGQTRRVFPRVPTGFASGSPCSRLHLAVRLSDALVCRLVAQKTHPAKKCHVRSLMIEIAHLNLPVVHVSVKPEPKAK